MSSTSDVSGSTEPVGTAEVELLSVLCIIEPVAAETNDVSKPPGRKR